MQTLTQQVQTPLSLKQKTFSGFFIAFLESTWNGEHFQRKGESSSLSISEIIDSKRGGYLSAWEALLQNSFLDFLLPFWNLHEIENIFKKKESLLA